MIRPGVRALPIPPSTAGSSPSRSGSRATAAGGAAHTSSGTNPSYGNVASATASPSLSVGPPRSGSRNATSAGVNVKYRIR